MNKRELVKKEHLAQLSYIIILAPLYLLGHAALNLIKPVIKLDLAIGIICTH
jgi:hypothetical protein